MPGKSKHSKKKRYQQINRTKNIPNTGATAAGATPADLIPQPAAAAIKPAPASKPAAPATGAKAISYEHIPADLKRIGILSAIIFIILIALKFILP